MLKEVPYISYFACSRDMCFTVSIEPLASDLRFNVTVHDEASHAFPLHFSTMKCIKHWGQRMVWAQGYHVVLGLHKFAKVALPLQINSQHVVTSVPLAKRLDVCMGILASNYISHTHQLRRDTARVVASCKGVWQLPLQFDWPPKNFHLAHQTL